VSLDWKCKLSSQLRFSNVISAVSTPAATKQTAILEGRGFQIANTSLLQRMLGPGPVRKRNKTAHIAYKFCSKVRHDKTQLAPVLGKSVQQRNQWTVAANYVMNTDIPGSREFVIETAIESTFIPCSKAGPFIDGNGVLTHFAIPPNASGIQTCHPVETDSVA